MATTIERPTTRPGLTPRGNRGLVIAVVLLAIAVVALGGWTIYDLLTQPETAAPAAVEQLLDDYLAAWNDYDGDAFMELTSLSFTFDNGMETLGRASTASSISAGLWFMQDARVEPGEYMVIGEDPYYVTSVNRISFADGDQVGISTYKVTETPEGLRIAGHTFRGGPATP